MESRMNALRGDIFYIEKTPSAWATGSEQYAGRPGIIVSNAQNNATSETVEIVYLTTQPKTDLPTHVVIRSTKKSSIAICEQINTVSKSRLGDYIASCTADELFRVDIALGISLGLSAPPQTEKQREDEEQPDAEEETREAAQTPETAAADAQQDAEITAELYRARAERDVFKELYERLLDRIVG